jgi:hypothetical protein
MSTWRRKAIELFPDRKIEIEKSESVGMLWVELSMHFRLHYGESEEEVSFAAAVYRYLRWCILESRDVDTYNAACIGFAEDIARFSREQDEDTYHQIVRDLALNFDRLEVRKLAPCLAIPLGPERVQKFLDEIEEAQQDNERLRKKKRLPRRRAKSQ